MPIPGFHGFIRWAQVSGPTDFSAVLEAANHSNPITVGGHTSARGTFRVVLPGAAAGAYVFKAIADNGKSQTAALFGLTASPAGAIGAGSEDGCCGCALGARDTRTGARNLSLDLLTLLLPFVLVLWRRGSPRPLTVPRSRVS